MLNVRILKPTGTLYEGEVESLTLPGVSGRFTILDRHAPIISALEAGKVVCKTANRVLEYDVNGGFAGLENGVISVCIE